MEMLGGCPGAAARFASCTAKQQCAMQAAVQRTLWRCSRVAGARCNGLWRCFPAARGASAQLLVPAPPLLQACTVDNTEACAADESNLDPECFACTDGKCDSVANNYHGCTMRDGVTKGACMAGVCEASIHACNTCLLQELSPALSHCTTGARPTLEPRAWGESLLL